MNRVRVVPTGSNLMDEVLGLLPVGGPPVTSSLVVFQGRRPGHFLRRALARKLGRAFIPPQVHTLESLLDAIYREELLGTAEEIGPLDAVGILFDLHCNASPRLGGDRYATLESFLPLGRRLFDALEELKDERADPDRVRAASAGLQFDNGHMLATLYERFYKCIEDEGKVTRGVKHELCASGTSAISLQRHANVIIAGIDALTATERAVIRHLLGLPQVHCLLENGPGVTDMLRTLGAGGEAPPLQHTRPSVHLYRAGDTHGQVTALARVVEEMRTRGIPLDEETVIVLPAADALFPLVHWVLPLAGEHNISLRYPVARTPVFGFLGGVWKVLSSMREGQVYARDYLGCVLHPYLKNIRWNGSVDATRIMFHTIEEFLAREKGWTFFRLEDLEQHRGLNERVRAAVLGVDVVATADEVARHLRRIHTAALRCPMEAATLAEAARCCIDLLIFVAEEGTASLHTMFRQFVLQIIGSLDEVRNSRLGSIPVHSPRASSTILRQLVEGDVVPFHGTPLKGLQVLGWLETRNLQFKRVCVLDLTDDVLPGGADMDPLLPPSVRSALGLPGRRDHERVIAHQFAVLLGGAEEVHLFYRDGGGKERSRFVEGIIWDREQERRRIGDAGDVRPVDMQLTLTHREPPPVAKTEVVRSLVGRLAYSATMLDTYLACPLRFYYAHVLGLSERGEVEQEIDRAEIGTFVHEALAEFHRTLIGSTTRASLVDPERMDAVVNGVFATRFGANPRGQRLLMKMQVERQLRRYLADWRRPLVDGLPVRVIDVEHRMQCEGRGRRFIGRADHVEMRGDRVFILDYKTAADEDRYRIRFDALDVHDREGWEASIGSLQLPFYAMLYSRTTGTGVGQLVPAYVMLGRQNLGSNIEYSLFGDTDDGADLFDRIESVIHGLLDEIGAEETPFVPTTDLRRNCPNCAFVDLCGTRWVR